MSEKPIIFSGPMVRAILEGRKTQTRRVSEARRPLAQPGDVLWVRETWQEFEKPGKTWVRYRAECEDWAEPGVFIPYKWRPSIHMPKKYARLWLDVTNVRVERLHDISADDIVAEGCEWGFGQPARSDFEQLWDSINGKKPGHAWDDNPWVWVYEFAVRKEADNE